MGFLQGTILWKSALSYHKKSVGKLRLIYSSSGRDLFSVELEPSFVTCKNKIFIDGKIRWMIGVGGIWHKLHEYRETDALLGPSVQLEK